MSLAEGGGKALEGIPGAIAAGGRALGRGAGRAARTSAGRILNIPPAGYAKSGGQPEFGNKAG